MGTSDFYDRNRMLEDQPVKGSVECLNKLSKEYQIVYVGARPDSARRHSEEWLEKMGYPRGAVYLVESQDIRLSLVKRK